MFSIATGSLLMLLLNLVTAVVAEKCTEEESLRLVKRNGVVLTGWRKATNARVEVCLNNTWGTICDDYFDVDTSRYICQKLGLPYNYTGVIEEYGGGSGNIYHIFSCSHDVDLNINCSYYQTQCSRHEDTGIRCYEEPECQDYQSRLVTDQVDHFGLVELCVNGLWRTVCLDGWDYRGTDIICHQLNFNGWSFPVSANELDVEFHDHVAIHCTGTETNLGQCEYEYRQCYAWGPAGAYCSHKECDSGAVTLVGGRRPHLGRVEFCYEGQWYTMCADDWEDTGEEARVICHGFGYNSASVVIDYYVGGGNPILPFNIQCDRTDRELSKCSTSPLDVSQCSRVAGVVCQATCNKENLTTCTNCHRQCYSYEDGCGCSSQCFSYGDCCEDVSTTDKCIENECESGAVRLVGGENDSIGALEVCVSGIWGGVCQTKGDWNDNSAKVICQQLQFSVKGAEILSNSSLLDYRRRDFVLGGVRCVGSELELLECQHFPIGFHFCDNRVDKTPVIICNERVSDCNDGEVRLEGGEDGGSGYVEFCRDGTWGRVCSKKWDINDARVICQQLYYKTSVAVEELKCSGNGLLSMGEPYCSGTEQSFTDCRRDRKVPNHCLCVKISCQSSEDESTVLWSMVATGTTLGGVTGIICVICIIYIYKQQHNKRMIQNMQ